MIIDKIQLKRTTSTNRAQYTPLDGEPVLEKDTNQLYIGDGQTPGGKPTGIQTEGTVASDMLAVFKDASSGILKGITKGALLTGYATQTWVNTQIDTLKGTLQRKALSGTGVPSGGVNGDVYIQYP